jgi:hypothetical protein
MKIFSFLSKRADIDTQAFIDYYENNHVPLQGVCCARPERLSQTGGHRFDPSMSTHEGGCQAGSRLSPARVTRRSR